MSVAVDQTGKNDNRAAIDPFDRCRPLSASEVIVIAHLRDAALVNNHGAFGMGANGTHFRRINEETADANRFVCVFHSFRLCNAEPGLNPLPLPLPLSLTLLLLEAD